MTTFGRRRGAALVTYASVVGMIALGVILTVDRVGQQNSGLVTRVAGTVNAVDGQLAGNAGPAYTGTDPAGVAVDAHDEIPPISFTGFSDPENDPLSYELILRGGLPSGELALTRIAGGVTVTGAPSSAGEIRIQATDPIGRIAVSGWVAVDVTPNSAPTLGPAPAPVEVTEGGTLTVVYTGAQDAETDVLTPAASGIPGASATISGTEVTVTAPAPGPGSHTLSLSLTDAHGAVTHAPPVSIEVVPLTCATLHANNPALGDGSYRIDPDGPGGLAPLDARCDMTGGGWTGVSYASDLPLANRWTVGDAHRWLSSDFDIAWPDAAITALRAQSTQGRQIYVGLCEGSLHHYSRPGGHYGNAVSFRLYDGAVVDTDPAAADARLTDIPQDGCENNGGEGGTIANATFFEFTTLNLPLRNIRTFDSGQAGELFGSPLTSYPAWFK